MTQTLATGVTLQGPHELSMDAIVTRVPANRCGVFALGYTDAQGTFRIERVGRDGADLRRSLKELIGCSTQFKFRPTLTAKDAFDLECRLFHAFNPRSNIMHPDRPAGSGWMCRHCLQQGG